MDAAALGFVAVVMVLSTVTPATETMVTFVHRDGTTRPRSGRRGRLNGGGEVRSGATPASRGPSARTAGAVRGGCGDAARRLGCPIKTTPEGCVVFLEAVHLVPQFVWRHTPAIGPLSWGRGLSRCLVGKTTEGATIHGADPVRRPVSSSSHDGRNRLFSGLGQKEVILLLVTRASVGLLGRRVLNAKCVDVQFACLPEEWSRRASNDGVGGAVSRSRFVAHAGGA